MAKKKGMDKQGAQVNKSNQPKNKQNNRGRRNPGKNNNNNNNNGSSNRGHRQARRFFNRSYNENENFPKFRDGNHRYNDEDDSFPKFRDRGNSMYERDNWSQGNYNYLYGGNQNFDEQHLANSHYEHDTASNITNSQNFPNINSQPKAEFPPAKINPVTENQSVKLTQNSIPMPTLLPPVQPNTIAENSSPKMPEPKTVLIIKQEKDVEAGVKSPSQNIAKSIKPKPKSSSESSTTDSSDSDSSSKDATKLVKSALKNSKKEQPTVKKEHVSPRNEKKVVKKSADTSSSSSTESSSSDNSDSSEQNVRNKKTPSEEEVICLGKIENIENLVDEDSTGSDKFKKCLLCDKVGHISFHCQTICKNCNAKYHGLKDCPKPANLSIVFQQFMQFCMTQCCNYNPDHKFNIDGNTQISVSGAANSVSLDDLHVNRKRKKSRDQNSPVPSTASKLAKRKAGYCDDSDSSSSDESVAKTRKAKRRITEGSDSGYNNNTSSFNSATIPFVQGFNQPVPFGFNASHGMGFNPMISAFAQMLGYTPPGLGFKTNVNIEK